MGIMTFFFRIKHINLLIFIPKLSTVALRALKFLGSFYLGVILNIACGSSEPPSPHVIAIKDISVFLAIDDACSWWA